jgi:hypothetical protein
MKKQRTNEPPPAEGERATQSSWMQICRQRGWTMAFRTDSTGRNVSAEIVVITTGELGEIVRGAIAAAVAELRDDVVPVLVDRAGIAQRLGLGTTTVDRLRREGMPCVLIGDSPRFEPGACIEWLRQRHSHPAAGAAADTAAVRTE